MRGCTSRSGGRAGTGTPTPTAIPCTCRSTTRVRLEHREGPGGAALRQLRLNPLTGGWGTVALERSLRPGDFSQRHMQVEADPARPCPFCPGNEEATPPALETYGPSGKWQGRGVANLYPALSRGE